MVTERDIAYQCAPVIVQKVNQNNPRGDFITKVDFAEPGNLESLTQNWRAVNAPVESRNQWNDVLQNISAGSSLPFNHQLEPYVYYSVVETHTHYFILYAVYHPQDWESSETPWHYQGPRWSAFGSEHEHDMEGALVVAKKRPCFEDLRADAMITISHWWFYSYASWWLRDSHGEYKQVFDEPTENRYRDSRVNNEDIDGKLWAIWHIDECERERIRPKLYIQAKGHGIKGDKNGWGDEDRIIRYCPSLTDVDEPNFFSSNGENTQVKLLHKNSHEELYQPNNPNTNIKSEPEVYRYGLISIFEPNGLWANRDETKVFLVNDNGQDCFIARKSRGAGFVPGAAKPPWSWNDRDDAHVCGELALQPAHLVYNYLGGIREFSFEYIRNQYLEILRD